MGLVGLEVEVRDEEHVRWRFVGTEKADPWHTARVYDTAKGRLFFRAFGRRVHLDECLRVD